MGVPRGRAVSDTSSTPDDSCSPAGRWTRTASKVPWRSASPFTHRRNSPFTRSGAGAWQPAIAKRMAE